MSVGRSFTKFLYIVMCVTSILYIRNVERIAHQRLTQAPLQRNTKIKIQNASLTSENEKKVNSSDGFNMADDTRKVRVEEQLKVKIGRFKKIF